MNDKYTKVVYQSDPIGEEKIVLYLTTFDIEAFKKDEQMQHIPEQRVAKVIQFEIQDINQPNFIEILEKEINNLIKETYSKQLEDMKNCIETQRKFVLNTINVQEFGEKMNNEKVRIIVPGDILTYVSTKANLLKLFKHIKELERLVSLYRTSCDEGQEIISELDKENKKLKEELKKLKGEE